MMSEYNFHSTDFMKKMIALATITNNVTKSYTHVSVILSMYKNEQVLYMHTQAVSSYSQLVCREMTW